jgi:hypothetical protein
MRGRTNGIDATASAMGNALAKRMQTTTLVGGCRSLHFLFRMVFAMEVRKGLASKVGNVSICWERTTDDSHHLGAWEDF